MGAFLLLFRSAETLVFVGFESWLPCVPNVSISLAVSARSYVGPGRLDCWNSSCCHVRPLDDGVGGVVPDAVIADDGAATLLQAEGILSFLLLLAGLLPVADLGFSLLRFGFHVWVSSSCCHVNEVGVETWGKTGCISVMKSGVSMQVLVARRRIIICVHPECHRLKYGTTQRCGWTSALSSQTCLSNAANAPDTWNEC